VGWRIKILAFAVIILCATQAYCSNVEIGDAVAIDGDTLILNGKHIRLQGIDAPEKNQLCEYAGINLKCGLSSRNYLNSIIKNQEIKCDIEGKDKYNRYLGLCTNGDNDIINALMVKSGNALIYVQYGVDYLPEEIYARRHNNGIWATKFEMPWNYRHNTRQ